MASDVPEPKEGKRGRGEEESSKLEERSQKLKSEQSLETISEDESGRESADPCHCDCWVQFEGESRERRSEADFNLDRKLQLQFFVLNASCKPNVKLLGTFRRPVTVEEIFPWDLEARENKDWYLNLVRPKGYVTTPIPSPSLSLFSLARVFRGFASIDVNGHVVTRRLHRVVGEAYSMPLHPPPSLLIPSKKHPLQTEQIDEWMVDERMIGSCNGLYCLRDDRRTLTHHEVIVIVWNPTTGLFRQLPPYVPTKPAFDDVVYGFGYDLISDDYKVVKIEADTCQVEVFSLYSDSNSWRSLPDLPHAMSVIQPNSSNGPVYLEGRLNWLISCPSFNMVASFDLATERFHILSLPRPYDITPDLDLQTSSLCILDGSLSFVGLHDLSLELGLSEYRNRSRVLDIWIMRGYVECSWRNAATIVFPHSVSLPYRILYLSKDVMILAAERVFVFNLKENTLLCPHIPGISTLGVEPYVESLVSPNRLDVRMASTPRLKERSQKLKLLETSSEDEYREYESSEDEPSEDVSADTCYPRSNCKCWVVYREKRRNADPDGRRWGHSSESSLTFVSDYDYEANVEILGTFRKSRLYLEETHMNLELADRPHWYRHLETPVDRVAHSPSPPLLSLLLVTLNNNRFPIHRRGQVPVSSLRITGRDVAGKSYSLPLHPPPSLRIRHRNHALRQVNDGEMVGSCNGLYCLADRRPSLIDGRSMSEWNFIVWNPTSEDFQQLPSCLPVPSTVALSGFGYDQSSDDYKVVKIDPASRQVQVFSLYNSESWRSVQDLPQQISDVPPNLSRGAVYFAGCLNWLLRPYYSHPTMLASFDLATESFRFLPLPPTYGAKSLPLERSSLCILDGSLSFVGLHDLSPKLGLSEDRCRSRVLDIWIMRGYGVDESWTNASTILFPHMVCSPYRILYLSKDLLVLADRRVFVFNLKEKSLVCPHMEDNVDSWVEPYVKSRVSVRAEDRRNRLNYIMQERAAVAELVRKRGQE